MRKAWLTRLYFSRGKHNLVLPAWVLGLLGSKGRGRRSIAGVPILMNTDLRSYIALGSPTSVEEPVVDHRGGIIPLPGSFTLILGSIINDRPLYASEIGDMTVDLHEEGYPMATVTWKIENDILIFNVFADRKDENEILVINIIRGFGNHQLLLSLSPFDQEGITEVREIDYDNKKNIVSVDGIPKIYLSERPIHSLVTPLKDGHAGRLIVSSKNQNLSCVCDAKAASWAASFPVRANPTILIPLSKTTTIVDFNEIPDYDDLEYRWEDVMAELPLISTSNKEVDHYFNASAIVLRLLSDVSKQSVTIGPSLQEEMWIPSLVFQLRALDRLGYGEQIVRPTLNNVINKIDTNGVIINNSQWDAQGAVVHAAITHYYYSLDQNWIGEKYSILKRIADWQNRQVKKDHGKPDTKGLLPKGTPSWFDPIYWEMDYYYFNNFWVMSVLRNMSIIATELGRHGESEKFKDDMGHYLEDIDNSITHVSLESKFLPSGPFKKDSSEMVFNLHAYYPLRLYSTTNQPLNHTLQHLWDNYMVDGGILIDQPWNSFGTYLSILVAQASRYVDKVERTEEVLNFLISKTTNRQGWAEGISPLTGLGSVGDSPNGYASAEYVNLILDIFIEENWKEQPVLLKGVPKTWLTKGVKIENMNLYGGGKGSLSAKLKGGMLDMEWNLENRIDDLLPLVFIPDPLEIDGQLNQISNHLYELPANSGHLRFKYN